MSLPSLFKIGVSAFIVKEGKILLLKRREDEDFLPGVWEVPGGGVEQESIETGLIRETKEEAGLDIVPIQLFSYFEYVDRGQKIVNLNFLCKLRDANQQADVASGEMEQAEWVLLQDLEKYKSTPVMMDGYKQAFRLAQKEG